MFEILVYILFCFVFIRVIRLMFKVAWGLARILATVLLILAVPAMFCLALYVGGAILLVPVAMLGGAWGLLRACF